MSQDCKYRGQKCFYYDGRRFLYKNKPEMIQKIRNIGFTIEKSKKIANEILQGKNEIVVVSDNGEFAVYNTKREFKQLLRTQFGIQRLSQKKLFNADEDRIKNVRIFNKTDLPALEPLKFIVHVYYYVSFYGRTYKFVFDKESVDYIEEHKIDEMPDNQRRKVIDDLVADGTLKYDYQVLRNIRNGLYAEEDRMFVLEETYQITAPTRTLRQSVYERSIQYINSLPNNGSCMAWRYKVMGSFDDTRFDTSKYYVGDEEYNLSQWANIEYLGTWNKKGGDCCAVKYVSQKYKNLYWKIKKLETPYGVLVEDLDNFCRKHEIQFIFKDINGKDIKRFIKEDTTDFQKNQILTAVIYKNHIYPYSGGELIKSAVKPTEKIRVENCSQKFLEFYNSGIIPKGIKMKTEGKSLKSKKISISSFVVGNKKYFENKDFDKVVDILKQLNITEKIRTNIKLSNLIDFVAKIRKCKQNTLSYLPIKDTYKMPALMWEDANDKSKITDIKGIDLNKAHAYCLTILPYLIRHDWRKHKVTAINKKSSEFEFVESYLYVIKVSEFTSMLPVSTLYPGYHLIKSKEFGVEFEVIEELETETSKNYFKEIIEELYKKMNMDDFKEMVVNLSGMMEKGITRGANIKFNKICDKEEAKNYSGFKQEISENEIIVFDSEETINNIREQLPINIQIKCKLAELITRKMNEMPDNKIIQVKTDAIYFVGEYPDNIKNKENDELGLIWGGWKKNNDYETIESYKIKYDNYKILNDKGNAICGTLDLINPYEGKRTLYMKYAGNGKTYKIINEYVKKYIKKDEKYIVLTPSHSTLEDYKKITLYKKHGIRCKIIQKYCFDNTIPKEDIVIIDEIGFCGADCHDFIHKLNMNNKTIICFGDFNQLPPVGESGTFNQPHYIKYMFQEVDTEFTNYRNNFSKEYYDKLITGKLPLLGEVKKHSTKDMSDAEIIICHRKKTRKELNERYMEENGIIPFSEGCRMLCCTNKYRKKGLWNHKEITIVENNTDIIDDGDEEIYDIDLESYVVQDNEGKKFELTGKELRNEKLFRPAYCINLYEAQGKTYNSYFWAEEDDIFIKNNNKSETGRMAYTLISRLKQE